MKTELGAPRGVVAHSAMGYACAVSLGLLGVAPAGCMETVSPLDRPAPREDTIDDARTDESRDVARDEGRDAGTEAATETALDTGFDAIAVDGPDVSGDARPAGCVTIEPLVPPGSSFTSTGAEGAFRPAANVELAPGVHHFTTVEVPAGVTVYTYGAGVLDLRATGTLRIDGVIDLSGAPGRDGRGGDTGNPRRSASEGGIGCPGVSGYYPGHSGTRGAHASRPGVYGGGGGALPPPSCHRCPSDAGGGGGGGYAGGAGGFGAGACATGLCEAGSSGGAGGGVGGGALRCTYEPGTARRVCTASGGRAGSAIYDGGDGCPSYFQSLGELRSASGGCGGGGSIGPDAAADLPMATTFQPGSGGGGGHTWGSGASGGGGGGGGALRLASTVGITVGATGRLRADGGAGDDTGGGGSGGAIDLRAPSVRVLDGAIVSAVGGSLSRGGHGGLGRIRIAVDPAQCELAGRFTPALASGCDPAPGPGIPGRVYIGRY